MITERPVLSYQRPPQINGVLEWAGLGCALISVLTIVASLELSAIFDGPPADPAWVTITGFTLVSLAFSSPILGLVLGFIAQSRTTEQPSGPVSLGVACCLIELFLLLILLFRAPFLA